MITGFKSLPGKTARSWQPWLVVITVLATLATGLTSVSATSPVTTIPVGIRPHDLAVNPNTNRIYVENSTSSTLSVIDGNSNTVITTLPFSKLNGVAVNSNTNQVYVSAFDQNSCAALFVLDGATNTVASTIEITSPSIACIQDSVGPIAVNPVTNYVYGIVQTTLGLYQGNYIVVVDGNTNQLITTLYSGGYGKYWLNIAVNPVTNRVYLSAGALAVIFQKYYTYISVLDGYSNIGISSQVLEGGAGAGLGVNPATNQLYMSYANQLGVLDGETLAPLTTISTTDYIGGIAANPNTNLVYATPYTYTNPGKVLTISGNTNNILSTTPVDRVPFGIGVTPGNQRIYVANSASNTVSVLQDQAASLVATAGDGQAALGNTDFTNPLVATLRDAGGNPLPNTPVTFTAPTSGASGTFANGQTTYTTQTNANGQASVSFKANSNLGIYYVTASASVPNSGTLKAYFNLTNATPAAITPLSGSGQSAVVGTAFGQPLTAKVTDAAAHPLNGATVVFQGPANGAGATFSGTYTATTDASGVVTSPVFSANTVAGNYSITANAGTGSATFSETNLPGPPGGLVATSGSNQSTVVNRVFTQPLVATVVDIYGNPINSSVTVTFTAPVSGPSLSFARSGNTYVGATDLNGVITSTGLTANATTGVYTVTASVTGASSAANFALINMAVCDSFTVTSQLDDGSCGTLRSALLVASNSQTSKTKTITLPFPAGTTLNLAFGLHLANRVELVSSASCGVGPNNSLLPPVILQGGSGDGLTLSANNRLVGLWVKGFSGMQIKAPAGSHTVMQCVKASKN